MSQDGKQLNDMLSETEPEYMVIEPKKFKGRETLKDTENKETFGRAIKISKYPSLTKMYTNFIKKIFAV